VEGFRKHVDSKSTSFQGSVSLSFLWKQESRNNGCKIAKHLDTRFREYDEWGGSALRLSSCSLYSRFAYSRFASRQGASTIPDRDSQVWSNQGIKLLLIIFGKNAIKTIIPATLEAGGQFDWEALMIRDRVPQ
jgi:hypothetical protein